MRRVLPYLFDGLYWLVFVCTHVLALLPASAAYDALADDTALGRALGLVAAYVVFLHVYVVVVGLLKRLVQPTLQAGQTAVGSGRAYLAWGLNSVFQAQLLGSPFRGQIQLVFTLRYLAARLFGMQVALESIVGFGAELRQMELITLGEGSSIGIGAALSCHLNRDGKSHRYAPITVGARSLVGAFSRLGPGVTVGDDVLVGTGTILSEDVSVGSGARIGAGCFVRRGVRVGAGARIESGAVVHADVPDGARVRPAPAIVEPAS